MSPKTALLALFSAALLSSPVSAQGTGGRLVSQNSLSSNNVMCMAEDSQGYVWIGTNKGLNRYDGTSYIQWTESMDGGLRNDAVSYILPCADGKVWVGSISGLECIENGTVSSTVQYLTGRLSGVADYDDERILVSHWGRISLVDKKTGRTSTAYQDDMIQYCHTYLNKDKTVWINFPIQGYIKILDRNFTQVGTIPTVGTTLHDYYESSDGTIYLCTDAGLRRYTTSGEKIPVPENLAAVAESPVLFIERERSSGRIFIGVRSDGIWTMDGYAGTLERANTDERLDGVNSVSVVVKEKCLLLSKDSGPLEEVSLNSGLKFIPIPTRYPSEGLNMFFPVEDSEHLGMRVLTNKAFYWYDSEKGEITPVQAEATGPDVQFSISQMDTLTRGHWVLAGYKTLRHYGRYDGNVMRLTGEWKVEPTECIWSNHEGTICLLQPGYILQIHGDGSSSTVEVDRFPDFWFSTQQRSGKVYFLSDNSVWMYDGEDLRMIFNEDVSPSAIYEDEKGILWIGTRADGVVRFDPSDGSTRRLDMRSGLSSNLVTSVVGDSSGRIYVASRNDVVRIDPSTMAIEYQKQFWNLVAGLNTNSAHMLGDDLFLGTTSGFVKLSPKEKATEETVSLTVDDVQVNGTGGFDLTGNPTLKHDQRQVSFFFSCLNFDPEYKPRFRYRLVGYDSDWTSSNSYYRASYSTIPSGKYRFEVQVRQPSGQWSESLVSLPFRIAYPWWGSPFAMVVYSLLAGLLIFLLVRHFTLQKINKEKLSVIEGEKLLTEQISQERLNFFTNVSHEFRTPLALIYGPVQDLARSENIGEKESRLVGIIKKNADRMARLTDQLLHFNRTRAIGDNLSIMESDLGSLLTSMMGNFGYMFNQKNLHVKTDIQDNLTAYCDSEKVERIVFNLLSNAVKYTPEYGEVAISASKDSEGKVTISVADTGIGISKEKMDKIFDRFERVGEKVGGELPSGFGVGLSYARQLALLHKGDLSVRSNSPMGSVFTFVFPGGKEAYGGDADTVWEVESDQSSAVQTGAEDEVRIEGVNVLVVEDNSDMREYIKSLLEDNYRVTTASDGEEAWKFIRMHAPDLIVSDVMMPYKDGYTLCKEVKNDPDFCHIPIILLTAKADMENQLHGLTLGADAYLSKPFDSQYLRTIVKNILQNRRRMQRLLSESVEVPQEENDGLSPYDRDFLKKVYELVDRHLDEEDFNVTTISMELGVSRTTLFTKLKALIGQSPQEFLSNYRLSRAMEMLKDHSLNVSEVAYKVGFATLTGFSRAFKNKFGVPPSSV
ncbi:MAG: response regulator [Bacteroidales bacterium]|nr:response regulator [Bacteroidales bacterium]